MDRKDWFLGRLHIIRRGYVEPQYGMLYWGGTLDVWFHETLWTFTRTKYYDWK